LDSRLAAISLPNETNGRFLAVAAALLEVVPPTREEQGCISISAFGSIRDTRLFYIHSRWIDEPAFDGHARLPHTERFVETVRTLIDHPLEVTRTPRPVC
jgi:quinol monooxygenase YgiN